jgi:hypothetical protein
VAAGIVDVKLAKFSDWMLLVSGADELRSSVAVL